MHILEESVTLPPDISATDGKKTGYPLYITAKRYFAKGFEVPEGDTDAVTILALHSTSFHKETWEPTVEALIDAMARAGAGKVKVHEVWAVDCPNHGQAGVLNREILKREEFSNDFGCENYAAAIERFLMNAPVAFGVDFGKKKLVGLGHSLGANSLLLLQHHTPTHPLSALIIVEPMLSPGGDHHLDNLRSTLVDAAKRRRVEWPDRNIAFTSLKANARTANWDERVLRAFVKHAVVGSASSRTVSLACTREQEQVMYLEPRGATKPVGPLTRLCSHLPIHLVLGLKHDFIPPEVHEVLLDRTSGRTYASVTMMPDVGHLIPQEKPKELGSLVYELLQSNMEIPAKL